LQNQEGKNMICRITKANLENLLLDRASVPAEVRKHVEDCPECRQELAALEATMLALEGWEAPEPSPFFEARMTARLRSEREAQPAGFFERLRARLLYGNNMHLRPVAAGALALLLLIGGGTYAGFMHTNQPVSPSATVRDLQSIDENSQVFQQLSTLDQSDDDSDSGASNSNL
jgi:anti-sigma factor RsiW